MILKSDGKKANWPELIAELNQLRDSHKLHPETSEMLQRLINQWENQVSSAEFLYRRAEQMAIAGEQQEAMRVYELAITAKGDDFQERARTKLARIRVQIANNLLQQIKSAIAQNESQLLFDRLDKLATLSNR